MCHLPCTAPALPAPVPPSPLLQVLRVLLDRLKNDVTRLTAVKALATIARSPLNIDLSPVLAAALAELTSFLRKANRQLRQAALTALEVGVVVDPRWRLAVGWEGRGWGEGPEEKRHAST
jgi:cullin-associated NEDD8-dissociated protein 1